MRQFTAFLVVFMFAFPSSAQVALKKGDPAPDDGIFLTDVEAAKVLAEKEAEKKRCNLAVDTAKEKANALCALEKENLKINLDIQEKKYEEILSLKDDEIKRLHEYAKKNDVDYGVLWFVGGAAVATLTSIAIFFAAVQITKTDSLLTGGE